MEPGRAERRKRRARRASCDDVVDVTVNSTHTEPSEDIRLDSEDGVAESVASTSVAVVDLTKDSNDSSILDVVDLTGATLHEDIVEVTPPKRSRRRRLAQQHGSGNSVVISSGDESDDNDLVVLSTPSPAPQGELSARFDALTTPSPAKKEIKCPVCLDNDNTIKRNGRRLMSTNCGHVFCEECIRQSITSQHKCPTCRHRLTMRQIHPIFL